MPLKNLNEITVERINIVEPDVSLKMVIINSHRQHLGMINGESVGKRERDPGLQTNVSELNIAELYNLNMVSIVMRQ